MLKSEFDLWAKLKELGWEEEEITLLHWRRRQDPVGEHRKFNPDNEFKIVRPPEIGHLKDGHLREADASRSGGMTEFEPDKFRRRLVMIGYSSRVMENQKPLRWSDWCRAMRTGYLVPICNVFKKSWNIYF